MLIPITLVLFLSSVQVIKCAPKENGLRLNGLLRINLVRDRTRLQAANYVFNTQFAEVSEQTKRPDGAYLGRMNMIRSKGVDYIGEIRVGQPGRLFRVLLDSGSGDFWLPSSECPDIDKTLVATYDRQQSTSFLADDRPFELSYVNGVKISGRLARETIQVGDLLMEGQTFAVMDRISNGQILQHHGVDGILGLDLASTGGYQDVEAPIHQMMRTLTDLSNGTSKSILSLSLNHIKSGSDAGQLLLGGLDESLYVGEIGWTPLLHTNNWKFRLDSIELQFLDEDKQPILGELTVCPHGCDAIADTGANLIIGNPRDVSAINERIGAYHIGDGTFVLPSCKGLDAFLPHLTVTISGRPFSLTPSQYTFEDNGICFSSFKIMNHKLSHWILGSPFIGHFYTILDYDNRRIGFAQSPFNTDNQ